MRPVRRRSAPRALSDAAAAALMPAMAPLAADSAFALQAELENAKHAPLPDDDDNVGAPQSEASELLASVMSRRTMLAAPSAFGNEDDGDDLDDDW